MLYDYETSCYWDYMIISRMKVVKLGNDNLYLLIQEINPLIYIFKNL
jgi:hypothetical protein